MIANIRLITQFIGNWITIFVVPLMMIIVGLRVIKEYRDTNQINYVRFIIFFIFIAFTWAIVPTNLSEVPPFNTIIRQELIGFSEEIINPYSIALGLMVSLCLVMIFYINQWKVLELSPLFFYFGLLISFFVTGFNPLFNLLNAVYIYLAAVVGIAFFYITGFRVKDNGSLGLGILFTIALGSLAFGENVIGDIFTVLIAIFGLIFSLGYFAPFKEKEEEM
ncbi:MAG: hypothetical protein EU547_05035 [Promethearchaeota archaeon]|nr:MAG: hypothetical protein EU547_05035 [Candidatus Lokiarchaeota archaeon]